VVMSATRESCAGIATQRVPGRALRLGLNLSCVETWGRSSLRGDDCTDLGRRRPGCERHPRVPMPLTRPSRLGFVLFPAARRRGRPTLAATRLDVLHNLVDGQVGGLGGLLQVLDREMSGIPMIVMHLATPTRDTHNTGSFLEQPPEERVHGTCGRSPMTKTS
jgi:hypothetical protein